MATKKPLPKLRADGQPKRSGRPPLDPTKTPVSRRDPVAKRPATKALARPTPPPAPEISSDFDDLVGLPAPTHDLEYVPEGEVDDNVLAGVTRTWITEVFRMDHTTVKKRLANCPTKGKRHGNPVYDVALAAQYLVPPRVDVAEFIKSLRPNDLPPILQAAFWDAQKKRQDWETTAGDLWHTDKVIDVLAETFKLFKTSVALFADTVEQETGLDTEQRNTIHTMCDSLMNDIHSRLVLQHRLTKTPNQLQDLEHMTDKAPVAAQGTDDEQI